MASPTMAVRARSRAPAKAIPSDGFRYARALLIVFFVTAVDVFNYLDRSVRGGAARYVILLVPLVALFAIRSSGSTLIRKPRHYEVALILLFAFGFVGTMYGVLFLGVTSTARALFLPMSLAIASLFVVEPLREDEAHRIVRALAVIATIYIVLGATVYSGLLPGLAQYRQFKNATFPYVTIGIAAVYLLGHRWWMVGLLVGAAVIFAGYASATSSLVFLVTILTLLATSARATRARPYLMAGVGLMIVVIAIVNFGTSTEVAGRYFETVGKRNTSQGRMEFWANGIATFQESPFIGTAFASDTVTESSKTAASPYHNDFVMFLAEGGLVGAGLLIAWIALLLTSLIRAYFGFAAAGSPERARLARLLLVGLNGFFVAMAFNPVLEGLSRSATVFALAAIASTLGAPEEAPEGVTARVESAQALPTRVTPGRAVSARRAAPRSRAR
jgi:O-antigen ligase